MTSLVRVIDATFYPDADRNWDDSLFRERILSSITTKSVVLDLGAGAGIVCQMNFKGLVARVCGVDLDPRVIDNSFLDEGRVADAGTIPYKDGVFDVVFADNVLEHLPCPVAVFIEIRRVLKPGGIFLFKTPNKWHYMPLIARLTPHRFHQWVNRLRGRAVADTFPTMYLANTTGKVKRLARESGLEIVNIQRVEGRPEYLRMTWLTYVVGLCYERLVNSTNLLSPFRVLLIGQLRKTI
jgi:SAM-dependent methyltransferase